MSRRSRASTEPRHRGRGSTRAYSVEGRAVVLQRSPGIVAGDRHYQSVVNRQVFRLQRSPGIVAGDRGRPRPSSPAGSSFNGAPASWPGIVAWATTSSSRSTGFNGAPASWPGIGACRTATDPGQRGFNGAPASWPGIARTGLRGARPVMASTEPRHRGRGSTHARLERLRDVLLQRSPGIVAGDRAHRAGAGVGAAASTEPRHRGRGSPRISDVGAR